MRLLGLAAIERARKRQASRVLWLKMGDASTKCFHAKFSSRRRKNFIHSIQSDDGFATTHADKAQVIHDHFSKVMEATTGRSVTLNWEALRLPRVQAAGLDNPFSEDEVWEAIVQSPAEKAPGPDGFIDTFFRACWLTIKDDIMAAFNRFYSLAGGNLAALNTAFVALLPKEGAARMSDFRPISLIHYFAKLVTKVLSIRLSKVIHTIVSPAQSAFMKKRCIQDSFLYVQSGIRALHRSKTPSLLLKLDISKAFDSISWDYLLELLQQMGFSARWRDWVAWLLSTSSSQFLLNGSAGNRIRHRKGLRQGDPLSPLLFILAIDPLQRLIDEAEMQQMIKPLPRRELKLRVSLYADDAVIFMNPDKAEMDVLVEIMHKFGEATGLKINRQKSTATPIRCEEVDIQQVLQSIGGSVATFPMKYLGLPLTLTRTRIVHLQFVLDRIRARLAGWKGKLMTIAGRRVLVRAVLSAVPTFALTVLRMPKKFFKEIDKVRRRFLWAQEEELSGGKCKVNWSKVCSPMDKGGLGIIDLERFGTALRQRWLWLTWKHPERPWVGMEVPCSEADKVFFSAATSVTIGNGRTASFWTCSWLLMGALRVLFPTLYQHSKRKNRCVADALYEDRWIQDLAHGRTELVVQDCVCLARLLRTASISLNLDCADEIRWNLEASGCYSASSAYRAQFLANQDSVFPQLIWKTWAPGKLKVFCWLMMLNRLWCNDRLQRRGWPNSYFCTFCRRNLETAEHVFWTCPFSASLWHTLSTWHGCEALRLQHENGNATAADRVLGFVERSKPEFRKGIKSLAMLTLWEIWLHRNSCTFRETEPTAVAITQAIRRGIDLGRQAGATCLMHPFTLPPEGIG